MIVRASIRYVQHQSPNLSNNRTLKLLLRKRILQLKKEQVKAQTELSKLEGQTLPNINHDYHADKGTNFASHTDSRHATRQAEPQNVEDQLVNNCRKHIVPKATQETDVPPNVVPFPHQPKGQAQTAQTTSLNPMLPQIPNPVNMETLQFYVKHGQLRTLTSAKSFCMHAI